MAISDVTGALVYEQGYIKRLNVSMGLNTSPSYAEFEVVDPDVLTAEDHAYGATGFLASGNFPGSCHVVSGGSLVFRGILQSFIQNLSQNGNTFTLKLADPRIFFDNVLMTLDGIRPIFATGKIDNFLDPINEYYGDPVAADSLEKGMSFARIKEYLENTGFINLHGTTFKLNFSTGFSETTGTAATGIPNWYRIKGSTISLNQVLQQVSQDFGFDYYVDIQNSGFDATGINTINVIDIRRPEPNSAFSPLDPYTILNFVTGALGDGTLISYKRGSELRTDPVTYVSKGPKFTYWNSWNLDLDNSNNDGIYPYWGRYKDGSAIYSITDLDRGVVILDHIVGTGSTRITEQVSFSGVRLRRDFNTTGFPPEVTREYYSITTSGYRPSQEVMRAAMFNQASWESALYQDNQTFAEALGITQQRVAEASDVVSKPSDIQKALRLSILGSGISNRDDVTKQVIQAVYDQTRSTVEQHYGRTWILKCGPYPTQTAASDWFKEATFRSSDLLPRVEFKPVSYGWTETPKAGVDEDDYPNTAGSAPAWISVTGEPPNFKDSQGRTRAFIRLRNYNTEHDTEFPYPVDLEFFPRGSFIEQVGSNMLYIPLSVGIYEKDPRYAIATTEFPLQAQTESSGFASKATFRDLLIYLGYSEAQIELVNALDKQGDNQELGLAPPRFFAVNSVAQNYGFFIPIESNKYYFGGHVASGGIPGGFSFVEDGTLEPASYGSIKNYVEASKLIASGNTIPTPYNNDFSIVVGGLPTTGLGGQLGSEPGAVINSISIGIGIDGFATTYAGRTYADASNRAVKLLDDKINKAFIEVDKSSDVIKRIKEERQEEEATQNRVNKRSEIIDAFNQSKKIRHGSSDEGYIGEIIE